jgi:hypothetical protein
MAMGRRQKAGKRRRQVKDSFKNTTMGFKISSKFVFLFGFVSL